MITEGLTLIEDIKLEDNDIRLISATKDDLELLLAWRSHPEIYRQFRIQQGPLMWEDHVKFWNSRTNRADLIIHYKGDDGWRKVGSVNISGLSGDSPEIGVFVGEITLMGKGIGKHSVRLALNWLEEKGYSSAIANISQDNEASHRLFTSLGFIKKEKNQTDSTFLYVKEF